MSADCLVPPFGYKSRSEPSSLGVRILPLLVLGTIVGIGLSGVLGGRVEVTSYRNAAAHVRLEASSTLRSGELFETVITISARLPIEELRVGIGNALWRRTGINTLHPEPQSMERDDRRLLLAYGHLDAGETLDIKLDGQVHPDHHSRQTAMLQVLDGERLLMTIPVTLTVLP